MSRFLSSPPKQAEPSMFVNISMPCMCIFIPIYMYINIFMYAYYAHIDLADT